MTDEQTTTVEQPQQDAPPAPPEQPQGPDVPDWAKDPEQAQKMVEKARREAADARTKARDDAQSAARQALLRELGLVKDDEPADPAKAAADLAAARTAATDAARELAIYRTAPAGTDVTALLDSRSFLTAAADIDPTDTEALAALIGQTITTNPRLKTGQAPAASGTDLPGGQQPARTYTRAQLRDPAFYQANKSDIEAALQEGGHRIRP